MTVYVCSKLIETETVTYCDEYIAQSNFITELSSLSYSDINQLLILTATLFATAWVWRFLSQVAYK